MFRSEQKAFSDVLEKAILKIFLGASSDPQCSSKTLKVNILSCTFFGTTVKTIDFVTEG